jgi:hypothetical protein
VASQLAHCVPVGGDMDGPRERLEERTERFALDVIQLIRTLPIDEPGPTVKRQLAKSATSQAANYRASRRARSHTEFTSRIGVVAEEADESLFWLPSPHHPMNSPGSSVHRSLLR